MKKFLSILCVGIFIVAGAVAVFADPPLATDAVSFEAAIDSAITIVDTVGTTDSQTVVSLWRPEPSNRGWNYYLVNNIITGANAANTELRVYLRTFNSSGTLKGNWEIDTIVGASAQAIKLPFFYMCVGDRYTIKVKGGAGNGAAVYTNGFDLVKYRTTNWNK